MDYKAARDMLAELAVPVTAERAALENSTGRILAFRLVAADNVPAFDRSPYDGYAFRAKDSENASEEHPVTLKILEEVPAGAVPSMQVSKGTATKILTGAPIPQGADAVVMYEKTSFTETDVTLYGSFSPGENIIHAGEDVKKGAVLAEPGSVIDPGLAGTLAAQGEAEPLVYRKPVVGIISTGSELVETGKETPEKHPCPEGKIFNSNRYTLAAALQKDGCIPLYLGIAPDSVQKISELITEGFSKDCDMIVLTGGVSAGDYDLTPKAMEAAGCRLLARGVLIKPGMACCYGVLNEKLVCALSGNPASSLTNYYALVRPSVRKLAGLSKYCPQEFTVTLADDFKKKSKVPRILKGRLEFTEDAGALMRIPQDQGNVMISSSKGCDIMAEVPAGAGSLVAGTKLKGFLI